MKVFLNESCMNPDL